MPTSTLITCNCISSRDSRATRAQGRNTAPTRPAPPRALTGKDLHDDSPRPSAPAFVASSHRRSSRCPPSPTLSPTDPVPRGLLTLCPAASSGPQGLYTVQLPDLATRLPPALTRSHPLPPARTRPTPLAILARRLLLVLVLFLLYLVEHVTHRGRPVHIEPLRRLEPVAIPKGCLCQKGWGGRAQG